MVHMNHLLRSNPDDLNRRNEMIQQLKQSQHNLMNVILSIIEDAIPTTRSPRHFRAKYPDDVLLDQINGETSCRKYSISYTPGCALIALVVTNVLYCMHMVAMALCCIVL